MPGQAASSGWGGRVLPVTASTETSSTAVGHETHEDLRSWRAPRSAAAGLGRGGAPVTRAVGGRGVSNGAWPRRCGGRATALGEALRGWRGSDGSRPARGETSGGGGEPVRQAGGRSARETLVTVVSDSIRSRRTRRAAVLRAR
jgi:hypothetical protein